MRYTFTAEDLSIEESIQKMGVIGDNVRNYMEERGWKIINDNNIPEILKHLPMNVKMDLIIFSDFDPLKRYAIFLQWIVAVRNYHDDQVIFDKVVRSLEKVYDYFNKKETI